MQNPTTLPSYAGPESLPGILIQADRTLPYALSAAVEVAEPAAPSGSASGITVGNATSITGSNYVLQTTIDRDLNQYTVTNNYYYSPVQPTMINQLPALVEHFVGQTRAREQLISALAHQRPNVGVMCSLYGMGGIGKTELAIWAAHAMTGVYVDGVLFIAMYNPLIGQYRSVIEGLRDAVRPFIGQDAALVADLAGLSAIYRQILRGKRVLIVLDAVQDIHALRYFTPPAGCALLATSRNRLLFDGRSLGWAVQPLQYQNAEAIFLAYAPQRANDPLLPHLLVRCDYLPLAIRLAGTILAERPNLTLASYLDQLERTDQQAAALHYHHENVYEIVGISDQELNCTHPGLAARWRMLHVCPATFPAQVVAAIWNEVDPNALDQQLTELCRRSLLLYNPKTCYYSLTNILRDVARQRCAAADAAWAMKRYTAFFKRRTRLARWRVDQPGRIAHKITAQQANWPHILTTHEYRQDQSVLLKVANRVEVSPAVMLSSRLHFSQIQETSGQHSEVVDQLRPSWKLYRS